jgi:hypothetical protein
MKILFMILTISLGIKIYPQNSIEVLDQTIKVPGWGEEVFYRGFAQNDQVIFNFEEADKKELKELEIIEYQSSIIFSDYKIKSAINKTIIIPRTGIYKFRFNNSNISARFCRLKIHRIPEKEETTNFNTNVYWKTIYDTTFYSVDETYLIRRDTTVQNFEDKVVKVHSSLNMNGNKTSFSFTLPDNTVAWSYYIDVNQAGQAAYEKATTEIANNAAPLVARIPGWGPLAALALYGTSYIAKIQNGEDIDYYLFDSNNASLYYSGVNAYSLKYGKVITDNVRMSSPLKGVLYFYFSNDNAVMAVTVSVKITAVMVKEQWGTRPVQKMTIKSHEEPYLKNP